MHALLMPDAPPQPMPVDGDRRRLSLSTLAEPSTRPSSGNPRAGDERKFAILLIEEDLAFAAAFTKAVSEYGFEVDHFASLANAGQTLQVTAARLVAIGSVAQTPDNFSICREVRQFSTGIPILWLQSGDDEFDQALMIELGADVCISRSAHLRVMVAQLKSMRRRLERDAAPGFGANARQQPITHGRLQISPASFQICVDGKQISLPTGLFQTFMCLVNRANEVITRKDFIHVDQTTFSRSIDTQVNRLRNRLRQAGLPSDVILSARGRGYVFVSDRCKRGQLNGEQTCAPLSVNS